MSGMLPSIGPQSSNNNVNLFGLPKNAVNQLAPALNRGQNIGVMVVPSAAKPVSYMTQGEYSSHPIFHS